MKVNITYRHLTLLIGIIIAIAVAVTFFRDDLTTAENHRAKSGKLPAISLPSVGSKLIQVGTKLFF